MGLVETNVGPSTNRFGSMPILVVDDSKAQRRVLALQLQRWGYSVVEAASGEEALALCRTTAFEMVLSDWVMPGMNGLDGLDRTIAAAKGAPVALITGTTRRDLAHEAQARGAVGFLPKTMGVQAVLAAVRLLARGGKFIPLAMLDGHGIRAAALSTDAPSDAWLPLLERPRGRR